ncbi:MAG: Cytochrome C biogenesis protein transmembrane region [candidate division WWE3 bacterium GW2011_GWA2_46_9]|uniref:Cytochrome C biogenesis protein transmembrane region n=1 Tax=candidate division WWE3 bacterium GW2011_GWA2_46_9 TaxID=1619111 RepID=A0A0G1T5G6_UNCKA|nr:MAG: Cytochrome C biogenesis protein transmembrane region [candidate division WWE3 bacterium GW2011_GWA2_46_9]
MIQLPDMLLVSLSFIAGVLTVLSPCILPVLPVVLGEAVLDKSSKNKKAFLIVLSLAVSVFVFTLALKASALLINVPEAFWKTLSGGIILFYGLSTLFPLLWTRISIALGIEPWANKLLQKSIGSRAILTGAALGPVFSSCSPTYALIIATILPQSFAQGTLLVATYTIGLSSALIAIVLMGQKFIAKTKWVVNPTGTFKKLLGLMFVIIGLAIVTGYDKKAELALLNNGYIDFTKVESIIIEALSAKEDLPVAKETPMNIELNIKNPKPAPELVGIVSWVNANEQTLATLKGKVVIVDFWTYSCINCIRTLPHLKEWHKKYSDKGLAILGIHTPEFAFEKNADNVKRAVRDFEIPYPVGLDNDYKTWNAYNNRYWPAKYFIDKNGLLRHYHFGEGGYSESEKVIQLLLSEGSQPVQEAIQTSNDAPPISSGQTPETYLGYERTANFANAAELVLNKPTKYTLAPSLKPNQWSIGGVWQMGEKDLTSAEDGATLKLMFSAKEVYLVMGSQKETLVNVKTPKGVPGADVNSAGQVLVQFNRLYKLIKSNEFLQDTQLELVFPKGVTLNAFTFGS